MNTPDPEGLAALNEFYVTVLVAARLDQLSDAQVRREFGFRPHMVQIPRPASKATSRWCRERLWHWPYTPIAHVEAEFKLLRDELFDELSD